MTMTTEQENWQPIFNPDVALYTINRSGVIKDPQGNLLNLHYKPEDKDKEFPFYILYTKWHPEGQQWYRAEILKDFAFRFNYDIDLDVLDEDTLEVFFQEQEAHEAWNEAKTKASTDDTNYNHLTADEILNGNFYLLGDVCYFIGYYHLHDLYEEIKEETGEEPSIVTFGTGGDGGFGDQHGRFYAVETGTFGIMDAKLLAIEDIAWHLQQFQEFEQRNAGTEYAKEGYGHFVKLENGNVYVDENKHVWFGNREIVIDASCMWDCADSLSEGPLTGFNV